MELRDYLKKESIFTGDSFTDTRHFYSEFAYFLKNHGTVANAREIKHLFVKREGIQSTAIGSGAAAPHIYSAQFKEFMIAVALIRKGLDFKAADSHPVYLVFLIMSDERDVGLHLKSLAHVARLVRQTDVVASLKSAATPDDVLRLILEKEKDILNR